MALIAAPVYVSRRQTLSLLAAATALWQSPATAHNAAGRVDPPLGVPALPVQDHLGRATTMRDLFKGRATALQLMFTGCSATCPIQGALFAEVQAKLPATSHWPLQLVSASIDPIGDTPSAMQAWLKQFSAGSRWQGVIPAAKAVDPWLDFLAGRAVGADKHTGQVYFFNHRAELVLRTVDFPKPDEIAKLLAQLGQKAPR